MSVPLFANVFSHSVGFLFVLFMVCCVNVFEFDYVPVVYFCFYFHNSGRWIEKDIAVIYVKACSAYDSSKSFIGSGLTSRSLTHFDLTFVYGIRKCSNFTLFM